MSGCGKTTVTLGLMAALSARGFRVAPFKIGPDFIDPGHHLHVTGKASRNLDGWMLSKDDNRRCFGIHTRATDIAVVEGVMGLFDGYDGRSEAGSTAQMAKWLGLPVLLVVDARSMARSAAALVKAFVEFDPELRFAGLLFNNLGSQRHLDYLREAVDDAVTIDCWGGLFRDGSVAIPERHLGLVTHQDHPLSDSAVNRLSRLIEDRIDLEVRLSQLPEMTATYEPPLRTNSDTEPRVRIGVAMDKAFCFYYSENFELLQSAGAQLVFFSPVNDRHLPPDLDGLYLGGGYPELYADKLSANRAMKQEVWECGQRGMPIYGECGGFMYLARELTDLNGRRHEMVGCFDIGIRMLERLKTLGYREIETTASCLLGDSGQTVRGHEFHYSEIVASEPGAKAVYRVVDRSGRRQREGYVWHRVLGSYIHLHFGSRIQVSQGFVDTCLQYRKEREGH